MIFSMNLSLYPSTSDNLNLMATQQSRSTTNDGDDDWQAQHPIQAYPDIDTYPAQQQQQPINWGVRSGTAMNSAIIWDFLMAQVRVQLRNMSPDECFSRAVELHMLARSEVGMRRELLFNDTTESVAIGQQPIVQTTASGTGARSHYHYQPFAGAAATTPGPTAVGTRVVEKVCPDATVTSVLEVAGRSTINGCLFELDDDI